MYLWQVAFQVYRPLDSLARPNRAACELIDDPGYCHLGRARHDHDLLCVFTLEGQGVFRYRKSTWPVIPGTGFLCRASDPHVSWFYPRGGTTPWKFVWLNFEGDAPEAVVREMNQRYGFVYHLPVTGHAVRRLMALPEHKQQPYPLTPHTGSVLVTDVLTELIASAETEHSEDAQVLLIRGAQQMIVEEIEKNPSVADIAERVGASREHFSRLFKSLTGLSPGQFILQEKMLLAERWLEEGTMSCKEMAYRLGYADAAAFSRAFTSSRGISPTAFRKQTG